MKNTFLLSAVLMGLFLASCKKENISTTNNNTPAVDLYQENLKLVDTTASYYFVADVEGLSGINKIVIQKGKNNALFFHSTTCQLPNDYFLFDYADDSWALMRFYLFDSIFDGDYEINRNEHKTFNYPSQLRNSVEVNLRLPNNDVYINTYTEAENAAYSFDKTYSNYHLTCRFKSCALSNSPKTKTIYLKNAVCKFW